MPTTISVHQLDDLAKAECKNEILLQTKLNTELHIIVESDSTIITLPFGNRFDIVDRCIIIQEK